MSLVLSQRVTTLLQFGHCPDDLGNEIRETEQGEHCLGADLPDEVGAARTIRLDQFDEIIEAVLDLELEEHDLAKSRWL